MARPGEGNVELNKYVSEALLKRNKSYDELRTLVRECRISVEQEPGNEEAVAQLSTLLAALTANVSAIHERKHEALVSEVLGIKLWGCVPDVLYALLEFTRNLVVANSAFTHTCLQLMVYSFTPPPALAMAAEAAQDPTGPWRPSEQAIAVHEPLLAVLSRVLGLVPTAASNMLPLIVAQMPFKLRDRNTQCLYLTALFRIAEDRAGAPIREAILTAVIEHLLSLDIEIKWEHIVDVPTGEEEEEEEQEDVFELEELLANELDINAPPEELARRQEMLAMRHGAGADGRGGWEGAAAGTAGGAGAGAAGQLRQQLNRPPVDEMANKMDSMMELVFEHLAKRIAAGDLRQVWDTLLAAFERTILNTHRSKFTQFLLFYTCAQAPSQCSQALVRFLITRLRDARNPAITRAACAAYLASFLARAAFLPETLVVKSLQELAAFCVQYCQGQGPGLAAGGSARSLAAGGGARGGGGGASELAETMPYAGLSELGEAATSLTQRHQVFYAAVQAVLYVLCYHMQPLVAESPPPPPPQQPQQQPHLGAAGGSTAAAATAGQRRELAQAVISLVQGPVWEVLNHWLQPLGVCLPSVSAEFVHQAASLRIVDCKPLLRQVSPSSRSQRPLEMFFPFDPYLLRRSSRYLRLKECYVRWRHGHPQAAAGGGGAGAEAAGSEDEEEQSEEDEGEQSEEEAAGADARAAGAGHGEDDEHSDEDSSDEDEELAEPSLPSDGVLYDPTHRHLAPKPRQVPAPRGGPANGGPHPGQDGSHHHHHHHPDQHIHQHRHHNQALHVRTRVGSVVMGSSYMSYASAETGSLGDGGMSPYGMSPHDVGDMLVQNPLGTSPGAVPMSLGTPEVLYMAQVPMRIGRK